MVACIPLLGQHRHHVEMLSDVVAWKDSWGYIEVSHLQAGPTWAQLWIQGASAPRVLSAFLWPLLLVTG